MSSANIIHQYLAIKQCTFVASVPYPTGSTSVGACSVDLVTAFFIVTMTAFGFTAWTIPTNLTALKTKANLKVKLYHEMAIFTWRAQSI